MNLFKNKKAMGLPMVLGIIVFVIGTTASLLSFIVFQSTLVEIDIKQTEDYQNAVSNVNTAVQIIAREQNLDPSFLLDLETYFNVSISKNVSVYTITSMINTKDQIISYMTGSAENTDVGSFFNDSQGNESDFKLSPLMTPTNMLTTFFPDYVSTSFPWITPDSSYTSFEQVMNSVRTLAINNRGFQYHTASELESAYQPSAWWNWYVDGSVTIVKGSKNQNNLVRNLTVKDGQVLFINGDLTMKDKSTIYGNVVVDGDLIIEKNGGIQGTIYVSGDVYIGKNVDLGTIDLPTFILAEGNIYIDKNINGVTYFLSDNFIIEDNKNIDITGGIYATNDADFPSGGINQNTIDTNELYNYALPSTVQTESSDPDSSSTTFIYTFPKLN